MDFKEEFNKLDIQKCLLGGFLLAAFYWLLMFDNGAGFDAQIAQARQSIAKNKVALERVRKAVEDKKKFESEIQNIILNMKDFQKYFSVDMDINNVQARVSQLAEKHSLIVNNLKPFTKENEFPKYNEIAVEFKIEGPFDNIMEFISSLTKMEQAIDFSKMKFTTTVKGDYPLIELETVLVVYSASEAQEDENG